MTGSGAVWIPVIAGLQVLLLAVVTSWLQGRKDRRDAELKSREKAEDYARQDAVAEKVERVAIAAANAAKEARAQLAAIEKQGKEIHTLVNSDMTAARTSERDSTKLLLIALKQVRTLSEKTGVPLDTGSEEQITAAEARVVELDHILADRLAAQTKVDEGRAS